MALLSLPFTFSAGAVIIAAQHNQNFSTIYSDYSGNIQNVNIASNAGIVYSKLTLTGGIVNADISSSAAIADSKLATISTGGKVDAASLTDLAGIPSGAGVIPSANLPNFGFVPNNIQIFTSSGTWTQPAGVTKVYVKVWGSGGGGSNSPGNSSLIGGGAGGYSEGIIAVTGNVTVTVGAAGTPTSDGATSSFAGTTTIQATGGTNAGAAGTGSNGTINLTGTPGIIGVEVSGGIVIGSTGGASPFGGCRTGFNIKSGTNQQCVGIVGEFPGGGGGGGTSNGASTAAGANGAGGCVIVYY